MKKFEDYMEEDIYIGFAAGAEIKLQRWVVWTIVFCALCTL